jgi:hypothetical protein
MTKIQLDLDDKEDFTTEVYKLSHKQRTKQEAIKHMINKSKNRILKEMKDGLDEMEK